MSIPNEWRPIALILTAAAIVFSVIGIVAMVQPASTAMSKQAMTTCEQAMASGAEDLRYYPVSPVDERGLQAWYIDKLLLSAYDSTGQHLLLDQHGRPVAQDLVMSKFFPIAEKLGRALKVNARIIRTVAMVKSHRVLEVLPAFEATRFADQDSILTWGLETDKSGQKLTFK